MPRFLEIRLIGHPDDIEEFVRALRAADILGSDSVNYPAQHGKVQRHLDVVLPGANSSSSSKAHALQLTDGKQS